MAAGSLLIVLRVYVFVCVSAVRQYHDWVSSSIAIWNNNMVVRVTTISVWGINVVFLIQGRLSPFMLMVLK